MVVAQRRRTRLAFHGESLPGPHDWQVMRSEGALSLALSGTATVVAGPCLDRQRNWSDDPTRLVGGIVPTIADNVTVATGTIPMIDAAATCNSPLWVRHPGLRTEQTTARTPGRDQLDDRSGGRPVQPGRDRSPRSVSVVGNLTNNGTRLQHEREYGRRRDRFTGPGSSSTFREQAAPPISSAPDWASTRPGRGGGGLSPSNFTVVGGVNRRSLRSRAGRSRSPAASP